MKDLHPIDVFRRSINPFPKGPVLAPLSPEQKCNLAEIVAQKTGTNADFETFCDCLLGLFEDIPGFETSAAAEVLLGEIWIIYRERIMVRARTGTRGAFCSPFQDASLQLQAGARQGTDTQRRKM